ncbi:toll-Interleukin receptor [Hydrogenophaga sp. ANAO-22]|uniref:toll-Interleukin receptor n=1 Tax=Hydrogenophaga sp. ANAO-22 TaxID=3166645 RepID=UPI0036D3D33E
MSLFIEANLRQRARAGIPFNKSATHVLSERVQANVRVSQFDIFLSHSFNDQELILGIMMSLEDMGYKVYVDWVHDGQLSRDRVTSETATVLRLRMKMSKSLFYATTINSSASKWMPWELGYMDGHNGKAAILPVAQQSTTSYSGQEYLGVYPYVQKDLVRNTSSERLWIHRNPSTYVLFDDWLKGIEPFQR